MSEPSTTNTSVENMQKSLNNTMNTFSSPSDVETSNSGFLQSNGIIAKVVFLIMVVIVFILLFVVILNLIGYFLSTKKNPILLNGEIVGNKYIEIPQNPSNSLSKQILRSNNKATGIEFTWAMWINYTGSTSDTKYSPVFVKGDNSVKSTGKISSINNGPGVYFGAKSDAKPNTLYIFMDTVTTSATQNTNISIITVENLPIATYFNLAIRCQNTYIDIYVNGNLIKRQNLMNVPKQNFYNVHICPDGGFNGTLSALQYFSKALTVVEINTLVRSGPNLNRITDVAYSGSSSLSAISTTWYNGFFANK